MVTEDGVAWFLMGEGSIRIHVGKSNYGLRFIATPEISFYNTEIKLLKEIGKWLDKKKIKHSNYMLKEKGRMDGGIITKHTSYQLVIKQINSIETFYLFDNQLI